MDHKWTCQKALFDILSRLLDKPLDDVDDEEYERINEELYGDVNVRLTDAEFNKEDKGDAEMADATQDVAQATITAAPATQDATTNVPPLSSSHFVSSNYSSIFFNLIYLYSAKAEVVSMLDINVQHEVQSTQTLPLLSIHVTVIHEPPVFNPPVIVTAAPAINITPILPPFFLTLQQSTTPIPTPTTAEATTSTLAVPDVNTNNV
ncbi:hypothetical protein Tco_1308427 [Tanacetum coccineum]